MFSYLGTKHSKLGKLFKKEGSNVHRDELRDRPIRKRLKVQATDYSYYQTPTNIWSNQRKY